MKLICIEEHVIDPAISQAAQHALQRDAPHMGLQRFRDAAGQPSAADRPSRVEMDEAIKLGTDLGDGRIRNMDEHSIDMQVVSYSSPAQLVHTNRPLRSAGPRTTGSPMRSPHTRQG